MTHDFHFNKYRQNSNIRRTLGSKFADHSDVGEEPGFHGLDKDNCKTRRKHLSFGIGPHVY